MDEVVAATIGTRAAAVVVFRGTLAGAAVVRGTLPAAIVVVEAT